MTTESPLQPPRTPAAPLLRPALAAGLVCGSSVALGGALTAADAAVGAAVAAALVLGVFGLGAACVNAVAAVLPSAALLVALLTYTLQVLAMAAAFVVLTRSGDLSILSRQWLAGTVIAGTAAWLAVHVATAVRARIPAYDLTTDSPGPERSGAPSEAGAR